MKAHLTKVSLALLSTVFLLGCQEQGSEPVGPEGPQFDRPGFGTCDAAASGGHCHGGDETDPVFDVEVTSDITGGPTEGTGAGDNQIVVKSFTLNLAFFGGKLTCGDAGDFTMGTGNFTLNKTAGNDPNRHEAFMKFQFPHAGINHALHLHGTIDDPDNWLPTTDNFITGDESWEVTANGPNHQNGCTGEGGGLNFTITIVVPT